MNIRREEERVLAGWAHDVSKPLQAIEYHARRLVDELETDVEKRSLAGSILSLSDDALGVIERLMKGEATEQPGSITERSQILSRLIQRVATLMEGLHPGRRLQIAGPVPDLEVESAYRLYSVLANLADNGLRASPAGSRVTIRARLRDPQRSYGCMPDIAVELVIYVIDRGCGMSPSVQERAFDPLYSTCRAELPTGLGLAECRSQVEAMGGGITLESVEREGTRVAVVLPVEERDSTNLRPGVLRFRSGRKS